MSRILIFLFLCSFFNLFSQKLYRIDSDNQSYTPGSGIKTVYISENGLEIIRPDSASFINGSQWSKNGVVAIQLKDENSGRNKVVLLDSTGKEIKTFDDYIYSSNNYNLTFPGYHSMLSKGKNKLIYLGNGEEKYVVAPTIITNAKGEIVYRFPEDLTGETTYAGDGYFSYKKGDFYFLDNPKIGLFKFESNLFGNYWTPKISNNLLAFNFQKKINKSNLPPNKKYGYLNLNSEIAINPDFQFAGDFSNNRALVFIDDKNLKLIDSKGSYVTDKVFYPTYDSFSENVICIRTYPEKDFYRFIDTSGNYLFQKKFLYATQFKAGKALVSQDKKTYYLINHNGTKIPNIDLLSVSSFWDENLVYDEFSGNYYDLKSGKIVFSKPKKIISIFNNYQLEKFNTLERVYALSINNDFFGNENQSSINENFKKLKNLKQLTLYVDKNTSKINLEPLFNLNSITQLIIKNPYQYSLDNLSKLKNLEYAEFDISNLKKMPKNLHTLKHLKSLVLQGKPNIEIINDLYKFDKNITLELFQYYYLENSEIKKLSNHFKNLRGELGQELQNNSIPRPFELKQN